MAPDAVAAEGVEEGEEDGGGDDDDGEDDQQHHARLQLCNKYKPTKGDITCVLTVVVQPLDVYLEAVPLDQSLGPSLLQQALPAHDVLGTVHQYQ